MNIEQLLQRLKSVRNIDISDKTLIDYINELEEKLCASSLESYGIANFSQRVYPDCLKEGLLLQDCFSDIYLMYLCAKIDLYNEDIDSYNNIIQVFNRQFIECLKTISRKNIISTTSKIKI